MLLRAKGAGSPKSDLPVSPELARALSEPPARPLRTLVRMLREGGWLGPGTLLVATALAAAGALLEATLLRASLDLPSLLGTVQQRLGAALGLVLFVLSARLVEGPIAAGSLRIGRQMELRLRRAFLEKLPRLGDRYLQSRPISDMAERAHAIHAVRDMPELGTRLVRASIEMVITGAAIAWLYPSCAAIALFACAAAALVPILWQPVLFERDLRVRSHGGALARGALDALLGLMPIRTHAAERAVRREHESLLVEWGQASRSLLRAAAWADTTQWLVTLAAVGWMVQRYVGHTQETRGVLLLTYWGLYIQSLGEGMGSGLRQVPGQRNTTLRLLEPLGALDEVPDEASPRAADLSKAGVALELKGVGVVASAMRSSAASTCASVPASRWRSSDPPERASRAWWDSSWGGIGRRRARSWWMASRWRAPGWRSFGGERPGCDPAGPVWNQSLLDNLRYGSTPVENDALAQILEGANVQPLLDRLPEGLQTPLGEGGALVSGGEGQRVRLGRAMMRRSARLVIFDEPFRGLNRDRRRELLKRRGRGGLRPRSCASPTTSPRPSTSPGYW